MATRQGAFHKPGFVQNWLQKTHLGVFSPSPQKRQRQEDDSVIAPVQTRRRVGHAYENHRHHGAKTKEHAGTSEGETSHRHGQKQPQRERLDVDHRRYEKRARYKTKNDRYETKKDRPAHPKQGRQHGECSNRQKLGTGLATGQDMMSRYNADVIHRNRLTLQPQMLPGLAQNAKSSHKRDDDLDFGHPRFLRLKHPSVLAQRNTRDRDVRQQEEEFEAISAFFDEEGHLGSDALDESDRPNAQRRCVQASRGPRRYKGWTTQRRTRSLSSPISNLPRCNSRTSPSIFTSTGVQAHGSLPPSSACPTGAADRPRSDNHTVLSEPIPPSVFKALQRAGVYGTLGIKVPEERLETPANSTLSPKEADAIKVMRKDRRTAYRDCGTMTEQAYISQEGTANVQAHKAPEQRVGTTRPECELTVDRSQTHTCERMSARDTQAIQPLRMSRAEIAQEATIPLRHHNPTQKRPHDAALTVDILPKVQPMQSRTTTRTDTGICVEESALGHCGEQAPQSEVINIAPVLVGVGGPSNPPSGANMSNDHGTHVLSPGVADGQIDDGSFSLESVRPRALPSGYGLRQTPQSGMSGVEGLIQGKVGHASRAFARGNACEAAAVRQPVHSLYTRIMPLNESVNDFIGRLERETETGSLLPTSQDGRAMFKFPSNATAEHRLLQNLPNDRIAWSSQDLPGATLQQPFEIGQPDIYEETGEDVCLAGTHDWLDEATPQPYHNLAQEGFITSTACPSPFVDLQEAIDTYRANQSAPMVELWPPKAPERWESAAHPDASFWKHSIPNGF